MHALYEPARMWWRAQGTVLEFKMLRSKNYGILSKQKVGLLLKCFLPPAEMC